MDIILSIINFNNLDFKGWVELVKLIIIMPTFLYWSLYDLLTKTVKVRWQRTLIGVGIIYNFIYLFIDKEQINNNITGFIVCYLITYIYSLIKKVFRLGEFGKGDVMYCAIIGLLFGTAVGVLTIILSFILFDGILELVKKIVRNLGPVAVAFFPFITAALLIILFLIGETRVEDWYNGILTFFNIKSGYIKLF